METYPKSIKDTASLREHQLALLELLKEFDRVCRKNNIRYMLFAGTLLGAVRHKGFIPWDDDLDVVMPRDDYERLLVLPEGEFNSERFFLQKEFSEHWPMFFSKLRMNGTTCIERFIPKDRDIHLGVYIDIFPLDNLSDSKLIRKVQFFLSKVVIAKALDRRGYLTDSKKKKLFMAFCRLLPARAIHRAVIQRKRCDSEYVHTFFGAASKYERNVYPREYFTSETEVEFEGGTYPAPVAPEELLTHLYGDYMRIPPESERGCKVHAEFVDLENSYKKYRGIQNTMAFSEYTRSIR